MNEHLILITNQKNWMEQAAKDQLKGVSQLEGVVKTVGLPDLHPGKTPVGMAVLTMGRFYPHLIGNDIGCGMGLFDTGIKLKKFKPDKMITKLNYIRQLSDLWIDNPYAEESPIADLGTIGSGNHFAEFQCIQEIMDRDLLERTGIDAKQVLLLIHSGSRGYGQQVLSRYFNPDGLVDGSEDTVKYMEEHDRALLWAERNRSLAAEKLITYLGFNGQLHTILDCCHNYLEPKDGGWLHRKGAVSSKVGPIIIPGSRGSLTYLCMPKAETSFSLDSLSHGSGRKWARSLCKSRINQKYDRDTIRTTAYKSTVVCHDTNLLFQEAPEAYKNVDEVIHILKEYRLIDVIATFKPLITYKG